MSVTSDLGQQLRGEQLRGEQLRGEQLRVRSVGLTWCNGKIKCLLSFLSSSSTA